MYILFKCFIYTYSCMASIQPVFVKIFEIKIGGHICLSAIYFNVLITKY